MNVTIARAVESLGGAPGQFYKKSIPVCYIAKTKKRSQAKSHILLLISKKKGPRLEFFINQVFLLLWRTSKKKRTSSAKAVGLSLYPGPGNFPPYPPLSSVLAIASKGFYNTELLTPCSQIISIYPITSTRHLTVNKNPRLWLKLNNALTATNYF